MFSGLVIYRNVKNDEILGEPLIRVRLLPVELILISGKSSFNCTNHRLGIRFLICANK